ncbi:MAG: SMP-30/gluconolactonase/LRE family protein [Pirellulaceae bacterium]|nr:SMP-30/gluconolactonase/LRE family protein [Pirellulaceae bacterium]
MPADPAQPIPCTRRRFVRSVSGALAVAALGSHPRPVRAADKYQDLDSDAFLGPVQILTRIEDRRVFTEGPAFSPRGRLFFTNVPVNKILAWDPQQKSLDIYREYSHAANGLHFDASGRMLACEGSAGRITRTDLGTGAIEVLAESYQDFPFAPPNDLCTDRQGRVYFTSRPGVKDPRQGNVNAVYRINLDGSVSQLLRWPQVHMPNGIGISPDNKTLYLIESHPDADHHRDLRAYDLQPDGSLANERVVFDFYPGRSGDGMCLDSQGNLYVAAGLHATRQTSETLDTRPGIHVISPQGKLLAFRETPEDTVTNCTFGDSDLKTLYVTCGGLLLSIRTTIPGNPTTPDN